MAIPIVPPKVNDWLNSTASRQTLQQYPLNLCAILPVDLQKQILLYVNRNYAWSQVMERAPFEGIWNAILDMYRIALQKTDQTLEQDNPAGRNQERNTAGSRTEISDSVVHDAVERLTDITHFVSFKEGLPVQFIIPPYFDNRKATQFYDPMAGKIASMNALLSWNFDQEEIYRKHLISARHFYLYGLAFATSEFAFQSSSVQSMGPNGQPVVTSQFQRLGTTFEPISIRKLWLNFRLRTDQMQSQSCPFYFEEAPRWSVLNNQYDPDQNPFGYANLQLIPQDATGEQWMYGSQEMTSMREALEGVLNSIAPETSASRGQGIPTILEAQYSVEQLWTFYPMLPLDPDSGEWLYRNQKGPNGEQVPVPMKRFVMNAFGQNFTGKQVLLRLQRNYYPRDEVPIYGSSHMPDLDSGLYSPSIGYLLWNHYRQLVKCMTQYVANKDWINDPPVCIAVSSPATNADVNRPGVKIPVNGPNDLTWRQPLDATASTAAIYQLLRDAAKQTAKSTDALMGEAMGSRTSATEASNAFQASMSAVTTPINLFNNDLMGGYANRLWDYSSMWMPPEILMELTGSMNCSVSPQDLWLRAGLRTNTGSTFIESIVRQQHLQYVLQTGAVSPFLNQPELWKMLLREFKFPNAEELVNDGGLDEEIAIATEQSIKTFLGQGSVLINPDQNHAIAIRVKTGFLEDEDSEWMTKYKQEAPALVHQIGIHQQFLLLQQQQAAAHAMAGLPAPGQPPAALPAPGQAPQAAPPTMAGTPGQMAQH